MNNEKEKKGLFGFFSGKKAKKGSCCCDFELEEVPEKDGKEEKTEITDKEMMNKDQ